MTFAEWISTVVAIAAGRDIDVSVSYPAPGLVTFNGRHRYSSWTVVAGAGVELVALTSPDAFTAYWRPPVGVPAIYPELADSFDARRTGRFVPRIPARAVSMALEVLFR